MKKKATLRILLIIIILATVSLACIGGVDNNNPNLQSEPNQPARQGTQAVSATATYGAGQFEIQLTAIAEQYKP